MKHQVVLVAVLVLLLDKEILLLGEEYLSLQVPLRLVEVVQFNCQVVLLLYQQELV